MAERIKAWMAKNIDPATNEPFEIGAYVGAALIVGVIGTLVVGVASMI